MSDEKDLPIPNESFSGKNLDEMQILGVEAYDIYEWTPQRDGKGKPEQVHLHFIVSGLDGVRFAIRFKTPRELDRMIATLTRHRLGVWPKGKE